MTPKPDIPKLEGGSGLTPLMLNHAAWVTHDVEATADFYTRIMGMDIASTVLAEDVPSTGDAFPYLHIFFRMQDGSTIAFFEVPPRLAAPHPAYEVFDHIALQAANAAEVDRWRAWLLENEVQVLGPVDHGGMIYSIYFHDPNGMRLEITTPLDTDWNRHTERGRADLAAWCAAKKAASARGGNLGEALLEVIRERREARHASSQ